MSSKIVALPNKVIVEQLEQGERKSTGGIILSNDNGKLSGIRSRWALVHAVGENITDVKVGDWVLLKHGRWSRTIEIDGVQLNLIDYPDAVLVVADEIPKGWDSQSYHSHIDFSILR